MRKTLALTIISALLFTILRTPVAMGCAISPGDSWYLVNAKITKNPLSDVLGISFSQNSGLVTFVNRGLKSTLYIASKDTDGKYPGYDSSRKDYRPLDSIIGHDFDPNVEISIGDGLPKGVYVFYGGWSRSNIGDKNDATTGTATLNSVLDSTDNYKSKQVNRDGRPDNAPIPSPDAQTMYAFYGGQRYDIELVLSYSLNRNYVADRTKNSCVSESSAQQSSSNERQIINSWYAISAAVVLAVIAGALFVVRSQRRSRSIVKKASKRPLPPRRTKKLLNIPFSRRGK